MGNKQGTTSSESQTNSNEIITSMKDTRISEFNEHFVNVIEILESAEKMRKENELHWINALKASGVWILNTKLNSSIFYYYMVESLVWCASAEKNGDLFDLEWKTNPNARLKFTCNAKKLPTEANNIYEVLINLVNSLESDKKKLTEIHEKLKVAFEKGLKMIEESGDKGKEKGYSVEEIIEISKITTFNAKTIEDGLTKVERILNQIKEIHVMIEKSSSDLSTIINKSKSLGEISFKSKMFNPTEIIKAYHPVSKLEGKDLQRRKRKIFSNEKCIFCVTRS